MIERAGSIPCTVANKATYASDIVAILESDRRFLPRYAYFMLAVWLREALDLSKISQAKLGRLLSEKLNRSIDRAAVNKMLAGTRAISADEMIEIERITGLQAPKEIQVPKKGRIGAGAEVLAIDNGDFETVSAPAQSRPGTVAVEVDGESMFPAYEPGTLLYYSQILPPDAMVNRRAVVQLGDGRIFVKILRKGSTPSTWNLQSLNPNFADMEDVVVEWVAKIDWIKP